MNKLGTIDIIKSYLGNKELSADNAFIGEIELEPGGGSDDRFRIKALEATTIQWAGERGYNNSPTYTILQYSLDGENWSNLTTSTTINLQATLMVFVRAKHGNNTTSNYDTCYHFKIEGKAAAEGNLMYMFDYENISDYSKLKGYDFKKLFRYSTGLYDASKLIGPSTLSNYCYSYMFDGCTGLVNAPELSATTLADYCYNYMFNGCTGLVNAPELSATTLADYCCYYMFYGCTGLVNAPELPAQTLTLHCYHGMFLGCTSLTTAPELPATTTNDYSYSSMFNGCTGLVNAPELPATTLGERCYWSMFNNCSSLNKIVLYASTIGYASFDNWLNGVSATGDVYNLGGITLPSGTSGIPSGWTEHTSL